MTCVETLMKQSVGSEQPSAFNLEYLRNVTDEAIYSHTVSYLAEYRFEVPRHSYSFDIEEDGSLKDPYSGENFDSSLQRAIDERQAKGLSISRETAEKLGSRTLKKQLRVVKDGYTVVWGSPPGPKEDGYGDYGFLYVGHVGRSEGKRRLYMDAIRVEKPLIEGFNSAIASLTETESEGEIPEDFLESPRVVAKKLPRVEVDEVVRSNFITVADQNFRIFNYSMPRIDVLITDFISVYRKGTELEKRDAFYALENYSLKLKSDYENRFYIDSTLPAYSPRLAGILDEYGYRPPVMGGSCGLTGSGESNNIFSAGSSLSSLSLEDKFGSRTFDCPDCGKTNLRPEGKLVPNCQHCGSGSVSC